MELERLWVQVLVMMLLHQILTLLQYSNHSVKLLRLLFLLPLFTALLYPHPFLD